MHSVEYSWCPPLAELISGKAENSCPCPTDYIEVSKIQYCVQKSFIEVNLPRHSSFMAMLPLINTNNLEIKKYKYLKQGKMKLFNILNKKPVIVTMKDAVVPSSCQCNTLCF